jgi:hypothetical protein
MCDMRTFNWLRIIRAVLLLPKVFANFSGFPDPSPDIIDTVGVQKSGHTYASPELRTVFNYIKTFISPPISK